MCISPPVAVKHPVLQLRSGLHTTLLTERISGRVPALFVSLPGVRPQKVHEVEQQSGSRGNPEYVDRVKLLEKEVGYYKDEATKAQTEVERLLDILREVETEKNDKDKKIAELER